MTASSPAFRMEQDAGTLILVPAGEQVGFRLLTVQKETEEILRRLQDAHLRSVLVDAGETEYLSSTVIGALIQIWETLRERGGRFALCNLSDDALSVIVAMRLDTRWRHFNSREEALQALQKSDTEKED